MEIVNVSNNHIKSIVNIHKRELRDGILNLFGKDFLFRMYVELIKDNWGLVCISEKNVVGFIISTEKKISLEKLLSIKSIFVFLFNTIFSLRNLKKFIVAINVLYIKKNNDFHKIKNNFVELSHFAVKRDLQGKGIGSKLIKNFELKARNKGYLRIYTRTHNPRLVEYYKREKNAEIFSSRNLKGYTTYYLIWDIKNKYNTKSEISDKTLLIDFLIDG